MLFARQNLKEKEMRGIIVALVLIVTNCFSEAEGKYLFILSGQSNMQGMKEKFTFVPRIEKEYGKDNVLVVKEAIGGRPIRMWVHDWAPAPEWKVDPEIPRTKPPLLEENGIMYKSMMKKIASSAKSVG